MIRPARIDDCPRMAEIHVFGWRSTYRGYIKDSFLFKNFTVENRIKAFKKALESNTEETYVYEDEEIIKGILTIGNARDEDKDINAFELWGIYIDPFFIRQKIGTYLVGFCIEQAVIRDRNEVLLWVFEKNSGARLFYEKLGFAHDGKRQCLDFFNEYEIRYCKKI